jgi:hypothetical protein
MNSVNFMAPLGLFTQLKFDHAALESLERYEDCPNYQGII